MPIASRMQDVRERVVSGVDRFFAETVRLSPMADGRTDPSRTQIAFEAILRVGGGGETNAAGGQGQSWRTQIAAGRAELHINRASYIGPVIKTGDKIRAVARRGDPLFVVLRVDDRGETRLVLELGEV
ncbi:hypothetical protein [Devosia sp. SD17-2]|uniref:hypothetical protein n=1 Tax=Devosia sp. SD17-2 TaxID=2976459 RepID=UPI0023D7BCF1|nr:hypothetical protein [Devosia sp. SD17-2]WEJ33868.1 hypothetical protein NYQ88_03375 [Devosia sp. SD17-2]